ncbi:MAG: hypothetical protein IJU51_02165 [Clostridia bacterium]|nr:hypothetical protein [Clostridia bacterium]
MNNTRTCPKCGSKDIVIIDGNVGAYGSGNNIPVGLTLYSSVPVNRYLCCSCGFSEEWINRDDISKVRGSRFAHTK